MQPNQKMNTKDGKYQVCLFPMDYMYITQVSSPDSYSHCCGHPCDYVGTTGKYPYYAPCDLILTQAHDPASGNNRIWTSEKEVWTPLGATFITVMFTHDDNPPYSTVGTRISQGMLIGHTGTTGMVTGDHLHLDQSNKQNANLVSYGVVCSAGNECYALQDSIYPYDIFFKNDTIIVETQGYTFQEYSGGKPPTKKKKMNWIYYMKRNGDDYDQF